MTVRVHLRQGVVVLGVAVLSLFMLAALQAAWADPGDEPGVKIAGVEPESGVTYTSDQPGALNGILREGSLLWDAETGVLTLTGAEISSTEENPIVIEAQGDLTVRLSGDVVLNVAASAGGEGAPPADGIRVDSGDLHLENVNPADLAKLTVNNGNGAGCSIVVVGRYDGEWPEDPEDPAPDLLGGTVYFGADIQGSNNLEFDLHGELRVEVFTDEPESGEIHVYGGSRVVCHNGHYGHVTLEEGGEFLNGGDEPGPVDQSVRIAGVELELGETYDSESLEEGDDLYNILTAGSLELTRDEEDGLVLSLTGAQIESTPDHPTVIEAHGDLTVRFTDDVTLNVAESVGGEGVPPADGIHVDGGDLRLERLDGEGGGGLDPLWTMTVNNENEGGRSIAVAGGPVVDDPENPPEEPDIRGGNVHFGAPEAEDNNLEFHLHGELYTEVYAGEEQWDEGEIHVYAGSTVHCYNGHYGTVTEEENGQLIDHGGPGPEETRVFAGGVELEREKTYDSSELQEEDDLYGILTAGSLELTEDDEGGVVLNLNEARVRSGVGADGCDDINSALYATGDVTVTLSGKVELDVDEGGGAETRDYGLRVNGELKLINGSLRADPAPDPVPRTVLKVNDIATERPDPWAGGHEGDEGDDWDDLTGIEAEGDIHFGEPSDGPNLTDNKLRVALHGRLVAWLPGEPPEPGGEPQPGGEGGPGTLYVYHGSRVSCLDEGYDGNVERFGNGRIVLYGIRSGEVPFEAPQFTLAGEALDGLEDLLDGTTESLDIKTTGGRVVAKLAAIPQGPELPEPPVGGNGEGEGDEGDDPPPPGEYPGLVMSFEENAELDQAIEFAGVDLRIETNGDNAITVGTDEGFSIKASDNAGLQIAMMHRDEPQPGYEGDHLALSQGLRFGRYLELGDDTGLLLTIGDPGDGESEPAPSPKGIEGVGGMRANNVNDGEDDLSRRPYDVVIYSEDAAFKGMERLMLPWTRVYAESTEEQALEDVARVIVLEGGKLETVAGERFSDDGYDADLDGEFIDPLFEAWYYTSSDDPDVINIPEIQTWYDWAKHGAARFDQTNSVDCEYTLTNPEEPNGEGKYELTFASTSPRMMPLHVSEKDVRNGRVEIIGGKVFRGPDFLMEDPDTHEQVLWHQYRILGGNEATVEVMPDFGYQYDGDGLGQDVVVTTTVAGDGSRKAAYTVTMPNAFRAEEYPDLVTDMEATDNEVDVKSEEVVDADVDMGEAPSTEEGELHGVVRLEVEDGELPEGDDPVAGPDTTTAAVLDITLTERIYKNGDPSDAWEESLTELDEPATVSLELPEEHRDKTGYQVIRHHDGEEPEVLDDVTYEDGTLSFETDKFSIFEVGYDTTYTITPSVVGGEEGHGTITPSVATTVNHGADQAFTFEPDTGYHVKEVKVDGVAVTPTPTASYAFEAVTADHTISVEFAEDVPPPVTTVHGVPAGWTNKPVKVTFSVIPPTGIEKTEYILDGGRWTDVPAGGLHISDNGNHELQYRSVDLAGNVEEAKTVRVRIDKVKPSTAAPKAAKAKRGGKATLRYRVTDAKPNSGKVTVVIEVRYRNAKGKLVKTLKLGRRPVKTALQSTGFKVPGSWQRGTYRFYVYATDAAGNRQAKVASNKLTVR